MTVFIYGFNLKELIWNLHTFSINTMDNKNKIASSFYVNFFNYILQVLIHVPVQYKIL